MLESAQSPGPRRLNVTKQVNFHDAYECLLRRLTGVLRTLCTALIDLALAATPERCLDARDLDKAGIGMSFDHVLAMPAVQAYVGLLDQMCLQPVAFDLSTCGDSAGLLTS